MSINIAGISKPAVLAALFNASKQQGLGFMDTRGAGAMTEERASTVIADQGTHFDYLFGRVMKISIEEDELEPRLYDRDNGEGAAQRALAPLLAAIPA